MQLQLQLAIKETEKEREREREKYFDSVLLLFSLTLLAHAFADGGKRKRERERERERERKKSEGSQCKSSHFSSLIWEREWQSLSVKSTKLREKRKTNEMKTKLNSLSSLFSLFSHFISSLIGIPDQALKVQVWLSRLSFLTSRRAVIAHLELQQWHLCPKMDKSTNTLDSRKQPKSETLVVHWGNKYPCCEGQKQEITYD